MGFRYRLVFNPFMFTVFLIFFTVFSALSVWQVMRVYEKQSLAEQIRIANSETPLRLHGLSDGLLLEHLHYRAMGKGRFLAERCFFVENVIKNQRPGLYVYCPFKPVTEERLLLVNLGWLPSTGNRLDLPELTVDTNAVEIEGFIKQPRSRPVVIADSGRPNQELDGLWAYFDFDYLQQQSDTGFYPVELQMTSDIGNPLLREWSGFNAKIGMHIGYAIHWAAFALVTLGLFLKFNVKKTVAND